MSYEQRDMTGSMFPNDKKEKDTHPNLRGSIVVEGVAYWLDAWTKEKNGKKWLSLSAKKKDNQGGTVPPRVEARKTDMDDIPF